jgi:hypothetical protein
MKWEDVETEGLWGEKKQKWRQSLSGEGKMEETFGLAATFPLLFFPYFNPSLLIPVSCVFSIYGSSFLKRVTHSY